MYFLLFRSAAALAILLFSLPASADLRLQLLEGGGNAAAYGQIIVFNYIQGTVANVPPNAFSGDNCAERPDSGFGTIEDTYNLSDTPLGTVLYARVQRSQPYTGRCGVCSPGTCLVYPACTVKFLGWSGECSGLGTPVPDRPIDTECTFIWDGDATLGATFQFESNLFGTEGSCVPVDGPPTTTTTTVSGPATTTTSLPRDPLSDALDDLVDQLLPPIVIRGIAGLGLDLVATGNGVPQGRYRAQVSTGGGGRAQAFTDGERAAAGITIIAKGSARVGKNGRLLLKLKPTRRARKLRQSTTALDLELEVSARAAGKVQRTSRSVTVGP